MKVAAGNCYFPNYWSHTHTHTHTNTHTHTYTNTHTHIDPAIIFDLNNSSSHQGLFFSFKSLIYTHSHTHTLTHHYTHTHTHTHYIIEKLDGLSKQNKIVYLMVMTWHILHMGCLKQHLLSLYSRENLT